MNIEPSTAPAPAPLGVRFLAYIIDAVICNVMIWGLIWNLMQMRPTTNSLLLVALPILLRWFYFTAQESSARRASIGKQLLKLVVVDRAGHRLSFRKAAERNGVMVIFAALGALLMQKLPVLLVGLADIGILLLPLAALASILVAHIPYLWILLNPARQGLHDQVAGSYVVKKAKPV